MKVADYYKQSSRIGLEETLKQHHPELNAQAIMEHYDHFLEHVSPEDTHDLRSIRFVTAYNPVSGKEFIELYTVNNNHEEFAATCIPWGVFGELEVFLDPEIELTTEQVAAYLLVEMTAHGSEAESVEFLKELQAKYNSLDKDEEDMVEISPGVVAPRALVEQMKEVGIFDELSKMSFDDFVNLGKPVRGKPKKSID